MEQDEARMPEATIEALAMEILAALEDGGHLVTVNHKSYGMIGGATPDYVRADNRLVGEMRMRDWLKPRGTEPETFTISEAGLFRLRRSRAARDEFGAQHRIEAQRVVQLEDGSEETVTVNEGESPLGWLWKRGSIDAVQCESGERLRRDFTLARMSPRMAANLDTPLVDGLRGKRAEAELTEIVVAARQRFNRAMSAAGPVISGLLFDVCCHLIGLEQAESTRGWPRRAAKVVLVIGLERLAAHYGLRALRGHAAVRAWNAEEDAA
ncbi:MAG: DUF6456 domain-containing protein [Rhizomicrobium sp.]